MTPEEKQAAKDALHQKVAEHREKTFDYWLHLFREGPEHWPHCGYSKGAEDMLKKLVATYEKESMKLMAPLDRGDFD